MSHIQTLERKMELETLADELGFWGHGKANTSFDIAGLFVKRCALNYLAPSGGQAAWVLPQGALDGTNWTNVRGDPYISAWAQPSTWTLARSEKLRSPSSRVSGCKLTVRVTANRTTPETQTSRSLPTCRQEVLMNLGRRRKARTVHTAGTDVKTPHRVGGSSKEATPGQVCIHQRE